MNPSVITYSQCPVCAGTQLEKVLSTRDFTVTGQEFDIYQCGTCSLRFTQGVPGEQSIAPYYRSENYISHSDTQRGIINRLYHFVRRLTLKRKYRLISRVTGLESGNLLDVGAGTGSFAGYMQQKGWRVTGLEPDESARQYARRQNAVQLLPAADLFQLPQQQFDVITLWHVLEHVHALQAYLQQLKQLLKPGGYLVIAVPNYQSADAAHYGAYWAAYDVPRHLYHFAPASMRWLLQAHGLQYCHSLPMPFDSYYVSMLSEKYKTGRQHLLRAVLTGWRSNRSAGRNADRYSSTIYVAAR